jgi:hypothetical protein
MKQNSIHSKIYVAILVLMVYSLIMFSSISMVSLDSENVQSLISYSRHCRVAVGVFSKETNVMQRDMIRQTWGKSGIVPRVALVFVVSTHPIKLSPHQIAQIERERALEHDILSLDTSYAESIAWFSWAVNHTSCDFAFTARDDTYVRLPLLLGFLESKTGLGTATNKYFGLSHQHGCPSQLSMPCISSVGFGVSRSVAMWISTNKNLTVSTQDSDAAVAMMLSHLRASSGLENHTDDDSFGPECTPNTILDSPALSQGFNMYERFQDDQNGNFCARVRRIGDAWTRQPRRHGEDGAFDSEASTLDSPAIFDQTDVPWVRNIRGESYVGLRNSSLTHFNSSPVNRPPWLATTDIVAYGGPGVKRRLDARKAALRALALQRSERVFRDLFSGCSGIRAVGIWLKDWDERREYVANLLCSDKNGIAAASQALVHVPFRADGTPAHQLPVLPISASQRLVVVAPTTCLLSLLKRFLDTSGLELHRLPGKRPRRIVLAWSHCHDPAHNFSANELAATVKEFRRKAPSVEVVLRYFEDGKRLFSRSRAINGALQACSNDDLVVVLDLDMMVRVDYFLNCLAFTRRGHTIYFPVVFSRYSPALISGYVKEMGLKTGEWLAKTHTITEETGLWRDFGMGMVAMYAADARAVGSYDAEIEGWGGEDISFFNLVQMYGYVTWRMFDPAAVHAYHSKDCRSLQGTSRHIGCLRSKYLHEGNPIQLALALDKCQLMGKEAAFPSKSAGTNRSKCLSGVC